MTEIASAYEHLKTQAPDSSRIPDFVLGIALPLPLAVPGTGTNLSVLALAAAILLASTRRPDPEDRLPLWAYLLVAGMIGWLGVSLTYNGLDAYRQWAFFAIFAVSIIAFASGRLDRISLCRGAGVGLAIGAAFGLASRFLGIGSDNYPGRLTGSLWQDPNQAGYYLSVMTAVALVGLRPGWRRWGALALFSLCIVLTLSRTSMIAMAVAATWFVVRRRVSPALGVGIAAGVGYFLTDLLDRYKNWGPFAEREGSDLLRERIDAASQQLVQINPIIGRGPGTAQVEVNGRSYFFHNAYLAVRNNGGWVLLLMLLLLLALVAIYLLRLPPEQHHPWHEAALIAVLLCALSLGEAFLRAPSALAIGLALRHAINPMELRRFDRDDSPDRVL
ncbi:MAG TPA: O-antigen ligase family protein [Phycicoccus sp.]|nr:O-antigen ligase family protein [Phycicoccus sp.]